MSYADRTSRSPSPWGRREPVSRRSTPPCVQLEPRHEHVLGGPVSTQNIKVYNTDIVTFTSIIEAPEGPDRTAALAAWLQSLFPEGSVPVLVGGGAVELYTGGAYTTSDLDFLGSVPTQVRTLLEDAGFRKVGRHWAHDEGQVFIEFPGISLQPDEKSATLRRGDSIVLVVAPEDLIVDRLAAWQFWNSERDATNAFLIWRSNEIEEPRLRSLARSRDVEWSLESLISFRARVTGREPTEVELESWARNPR